MAHLISKSWNNRAEGSKVEWQAWPRSPSFHTALMLHIARSNGHFQTLLDKLFRLRQKAQCQKWGREGGNPCYSFTYWDFVPTIKVESWTNTPPKLQNGPFCLFKHLDLCLRDDPWEQNQEVLDFQSPQEENWKSVPCCFLLFYKKQSTKCRLFENTKVVWVFFPETVSPV